VRSLVVGSVMRRCSGLEWWDVKRAGADAGVRVLGFKVRARSSAG